MPLNRTAPLFLALAVLLSTGAAFAQGDYTPEYDAAAFAARIVVDGGKLDYVFGEERAFASCHASTLVEADDGTLLCAFFAGAEEGNPDVGIWLSRYVDGAWSAPVRVAKVNETAHWNPVLFRDPAKGTFLFFKVGPQIPYWQTYWCRTEDNGKTWSEPVELVPGDKGGRGPVKNKAIVLSDGTWLAGASTEHTGWQPFGDRSTDGGKTWERSANFSIDPEVIVGRGAIQPTLWESAPGTVHALLRTTGGWIGLVDSTDGGKTWSPLMATSLPNNNSGIDALRLEDGRLLLVYNPTGEPNKGGPRTPLNMAVSKDNGATWKDVVSFEGSPGEYSYPAIVRTKTGVAVCYTWKRQRVRCWQIPLAYVE
jgi:predicted neuraminidase